MALMGALKRDKGMKNVTCTKEGFLIVTKPVLAIPVIHPFGRGAGTSTGAQYCTEYTQTATTNTYQTVEEVKVDWGIEGRIIELEFGLTGSFAAASTTTADLIYLWSGKSMGQTSWYSFHAAVTKTNINTTNVEETYSGLIGTATSAGTMVKSILPGELSTIPFLARLQVQSNEASQAQGKTKNSSYFKATIIPD